MDNKKINLLLILATGLSALFAIILLVFGFVYDGGALARAMLFVAAFILFALSIEVLYLFVLSRDVKPNYFLFNASLNSNIPVSKLTFETVDKRMNKYLSTFAKSEAKIWTDGVLENNQSAIAPEYRPIVAYKLLFDIAQSDTEGAWKCFVLASERTVDYIAMGVAQNGDNQLAASLRQLKSAKPVNMKQTRDFLVSNKQYIKKKLYKYVVANIDRF